MVILQESIPEQSEENGASQHENNTPQICNQITNIFNEFCARLESKLNTRLENELSKISRKVDNMEAKINVVYLPDQQMN